MDTDRETLDYFYRATGGDLWNRRDGWDENDLGSRFGVKTDKGRVVKLDMAVYGMCGNNLIGKCLHLYFLPVSVILLCVASPIKDKYILQGCISIHGTEVDSHDLLEVVDQVR